MPGAAVNDQASEKLDEILCRLAAVEQKIVSKRWFAIVIVLITAAAGLVVYATEKALDRLFIQNDSAEQTLGKLRAQETMALLSKSMNLLSSLDSAFQEYCLISQDQAALDKVTETAAAFTRLSKSAVFERQLQLELQGYVNFVTGRLLDMSAPLPGPPSREAVYREARQAYDGVVTMITDRIQELSR